jgi:uncharacterized protein HemY
MYSIAEPYYVSSCSLYFAIASASKSLYIYVSLFTNPSYNKNIYLTLLFLVVKLLALYFIKYGLNHLSVYPAKNNPV